MLHQRRKPILVLVLFAALTLLSACNPYRVIGDSITVQAFDPSADGGDPELQGTPPDHEIQVYAGLGWKVEQVQQYVTDSMDTTESYVFALGTNDSNPVWNGGWTTDDVTRFQTLLATPNPTTCVVVVLPGYGAGIDPVHAAEMDEARVSITALATARPATVIADWQDVINAHPEYISPDGIHLRTVNDTPTDDGVLRPVVLEAAEARQQLGWDALSQCP